LLNFENGIAGTGLGRPGSAEGHRKIGGVDRSKLLTRLPEFVSTFRGFRWEEFNTE